MDFSTLLLLSLTHFTFDRRLEGAFLYGCGVASTLPNSVHMSLYRYVYTYTGTDIDKEVDLDVDMSTVLYVYVSAS